MRRLKIRWHFINFFPSKSPIRNLLFRFLATSPTAWMELGSSLITKMTSWHKPIEDVPGCAEAFFEENFHLDHVCNAQLTQKPQGIPVVPGHIGWFGWEHPWFKRDHHEWRSVLGEFSVIEMRWKRRCQVLEVGSPECVPHGWSWQCIKQRLPLSGAREMRRYHSYHTGWFALQQLGSMFWDLGSSTATDTYSLLKTQCFCGSILGIKRRSMKPCSLCSMPDPRMMG